MISSYWIYVNSIVKTDLMGVVISASIGGLAETPPMAKWNVPIGSDQASACFIGKRYKITIEES